MCAAVPAASGTRDNTQSQTFARGAGLHPGGSSRDAGSSTGREGRGQAQVVPRKLAAHDPAQGCVLRAQSPLSSSSGPAPVRGREGQKASRRRAGDSCGLLQVTPPRRVQRLWVPRVCQGPCPSPQGGPSRVAFQGHPASDSGRPGPDPKRPPQAGRVPLGRALLPPSHPHASSSRDHSFCHGLN